MPATPGDVDGLLDASAYEAQARRLIRYVRSSRPGPKEFPHAVLHRLWPAEP
ncbi:hypothetical protein [Nocardioides convexus]|uniref:hypothetical protein n=1 Tax=Nocardioides convexus TaxID=2712224 RepID=UPI0031013E3E